MARAFANEVLRSEAEQYIFGRVGWLNKITKQKTNKPVTHSAMC